MIFIRFQQFPLRCENVIMTVFNLAVYTCLWLLSVHGDPWYAQNATRMSEISRILRFQLFTLQNYKSFKTQNENGKKSLRKLLRFSCYPFSL